MSILAPLGPVSFRVGIKALSRESGRIACASATRYIATACGGPLGLRSFPPKNSISAICLGASKDSSARYRQYLPRTTKRTLFRYTAITQYSRLPDDYEDVTGLQFRKEPLTQKEVNAIFKTDISDDEANQLLKIIHGRRVAGTLDDPDLQQNTASYNVDDKITALEYLRENIPVDEVINAGLRAEDELRYLEEREQSPEATQEDLQVVDSPKVKSKSAAETETAPVASVPAVPTGRLPRKPKPDSVYGEGEFDRIRKINRAKREEEERRLEEEQQEKDAEAALGNIGPLSTEQAAPRQMSPWVQKHHDAATSDLEAPPEMKWWERLLPTYCMAALILAGCATLAVYYRPMARDQRIWPDVPPAAATCIGLILLNLTMFIAWRIPPLWAFFNKYMIVVAATPRPLQLIGAMFSHHTFGHLAGNMVCLWLFGVRLHDDIGRGNFLAVYFASGTLGFLASLTQLVVWRGLQYTTLGASGAVYGIIAAYFWLHRFEEFKVLGYPPDPIQGPQGLAFLGIIVGLHIFGIFSTSARAALVDIPSHLGGMFGGIISIDLIQRRMERLVGVSLEEIKQPSAMSEPNVDQPGKSASSKARIPKSTGAS